MTYSVKEIFYTLQGEGANAGRPAVFCRFSGCNLWSGQEKDRDAAICRFCDTDFVGVDGIRGGKFESAEQLARAIETTWGHASRDYRLVVLTGGEPMLQVDDALVAALHDRGFQVAIETNGTIAPVSGLDWVCVSPKAGSAVVAKSGNELKVVFPQADLDPSRFIDWNFTHFFLQPKDDENLKDNTAKAIDYCRSNPQWRLSVQTHKVLNIP